VKEHKVRKLEVRAKKGNPKRKKVKQENLKEMQRL